MTDTPTPIYSTLYTGVTIVTQENPFTTPIPTTLEGEVVLAEQDNPFTSPIPVEVENKVVLAQQANPFTSSVPVEVENKVLLAEQGNPFTASIPTTVSNRIGLEQQINPFTTSIPVVLSEGVELKRQGNPFTADIPVSLGTEKVVLGAGTSSIGSISAITTAVTVTPQTSSASTSLSVRLSNGTDFSDIDFNFLLQIVQSVYGINGGEYITSATGGTASLTAKSYYAMLVMSDSTTFSTLTSNINNLPVSGYSKGDLIRAEYTAATVSAGSAIFYYKE